MRRAGQLLQLHFELDTEEPVDLVMSYDREQVEFSGFLQSADPAESLDMQAGRVVLKAQGKQQFIVEFSALTEAEATVQVSFDSNGESLDTLTVGPSEGGPN